MLAIVLHSALPTGAPRIGLELACWLHENSYSVTLVSPESGPITDEAQQRGVKVVIAEGIMRDADMPEVVERLSDLISDLGATSIYCNSAASGIWAISARKLGLRVVMHAHELFEDLSQLERHGAVLRDIGKCLETLVVASPRVTSDFSKALGFVPSDIFDIGVFVEPEKVRADARARISPDWKTRAPSSDGRPRVGMCGTACRRKGFDRFVEMAQGLPDFDFVWVGGFDPYAQSLLQGEDDIPDNLFLSGHVSNPYPLIKDFDVMLVTSREDPNPIAAIEAVALGVPVITFTGAGDTWRMGGNGVYAIHGEFDADLAASALEVVINSRPVPVSDLPAGFSRDACLGKLTEFLASRGHIKSA